MKCLPTLEYDFPFIPILKPLLRDVKYFTNVYLWQIGKQTNEYFVSKNKYHFYQNFLRYFLFFMFINVNAE